MKRSSDLALGSWQFGPSHGFWIGGTIEASRLTIRAAYKAGIRHFDTAPAYGNGLAEQLLGSALSGKSVHIDTKFMPKKPFLVEQDVQKSLDRLKTPSINTLYLHWPSSSVELRPIVEAAARLIEQGKVHHLGLSNAPLSLVQAMQDLPITFLQVPCSLLWTRGLEEYKQYAEKQGISLVGYSPLGLGLLSGKYPERPNDSRGNLYVYKDTAYPVFHELLELLSFLAKKKAISMAQVALVWARSHNFTNILIGARSPEQLSPLLETDAFSLDEGEKRLLDEVAGRLCACAPPSWDNLFFGHRW